MNGQEPEGDGYLEGKGYGGGGGRYDSQGKAGVVIMTFKN